MVYIVGLILMNFGFLAALVIQHKRITELENKVLNLRIKINERRVKN